MKKILLSIVAGGIMMSSCEQNNTSNVKLNNENDSLSYLIGISIGESFTRGEIKDLNYELLLQGMKDQTDSTRTPAFTVKEAEEMLQDIFRKRDEEKAQVLKKEGQEFLEKNKQEAGVQVTPSGLQYKVISEGTGAKPLATDKVTVHYKGTLIDGSTFDSSYERGEPATFVLNGVIPGWTEGLQLMSVGSKYMFYIPSELGYGPQQNGMIKPYSTLIFEVELLGIEQ